MMRRQIDVASRLRPDELRQLMRGFRHITPRPFDISWRGHHFIIEPEHSWFSVFPRSPRYFYGEVQQMEGGSHISGRFRFRPIVRSFLYMWHGVFAFALMFGFFKVIEAVRVGDEVWPAIIIVVGTLLIWLSMGGVWFYVWLWSDHEREIVRWLEGFGSQERRVGERG